MRRDEEHILRKVLIMMHIREKEGQKQDGKTRANKTWKVQD